MDVGVGQLGQHPARQVQGLAVRRVELLTLVRFREEAVDERLEPIMPHGCGDRSLGCVGSVLRSLLRRGRSCESCCGCGAVAAALLLSCFHLSSCFQPDLVQRVLLQLGLGLRTLLVSLGLFGLQLRLSDGCLRFVPAGDCVLSIRLRHVQELSLQRVGALHMVLV